MSNYARGRTREYQTMHTLRRDGWVCSRSAMSHGPVDVFAARAGRILLIQVKSGSSRMKSGEVEILKLRGEHFNASAEIWYYKKRGRLQKHCVRKQILAEPAIAVSPSLP